jgi:hypothetical protein
MAVMPSDSLMNRIEKWINSGDSAVGFDMEVLTSNLESVTSLICLPGDKQNLGVALPDPASPRLRASYRRVPEHESFQVPGG